MAKKKKSEPLTEEDCNWIVQNMGIQDPETVRDDAPSPGAYGGLVQAQGNHRVYEWVLNRTTPKTFVSEGDGKRSKESLNFTGLRKRLLDEFGKNAAAIL